MVHVHAYSIVQYIIGILLPKSWINIALLHQEKGNDQEINHVKHEAGSSIMMYLESQKYASESIPSNDFKTQTISVL